MAWGRVEVADRVDADDSSYPLGAREFFREERWRRYNQLSRMAIHAGKVKDARDFLKKSFETRTSVF